MDVYEMRRGLRFPIHGKFILLMYLELFKGRISTEGNYQSIMSGTFNFWEVQQFVKQKLYTMTKTDIALEIEKIMAITTASKTVHFPGSCCFFYSRPTFWHMWGLLRQGVLPTCAYQCIFSFCFLLWKSWGLKQPVWETVISCDSILSHIFPV